MHSTSWKSFLIVQTPIGLGIRKPKCYAWLCLIPKLDLVRESSSIKVEQNLPSPPFFQSCDKFKWDRACDNAFHPRAPSPDGGNSVLWLEALLDTYSSHNAQVFWNAANLKYFAWLSFYKYLKVYKNTSHSRIAVFCLFVYFYILFEKWKKIHPADYCRWGWASDKFFPQTFGNKADV